MKKITSSILAVALMGIFAIQNIYAQQDANQTLPKVEQPPQFPGGVDSLMKWLSANVEYPIIAQKEGAQGRVLIQFIVEKDGSIGEAKVARSCHPELDKEALRVVKNLPKFIPGKHNGQDVRCMFALPINFKLPPAEIENKE
jgi:protein TonB